MTLEEILAGLLRAKDSLGVETTAKLAVAIVQLDLRRREAEAAAEKADDAREANRERKRRQREVCGDISPALRFHVLSRDGYGCRYCGRCAHDVELEIDHVIPRSRGGTNDADNLAASCRDCNRGKGDRDAAQ